MFGTSKVLNLWSNTALKLENESDYQRLVPIGNHFAKSGSKVEILPGFDATLKNPEYKKIFGDLEGTKY